MLRFDPQSAFHTGALIDTARLGVEACCTLHDTHFSGRFLWFVVRPERRLNGWRESLVFWVMVLILWMFYYNHQAYWSMNGSYFMMFNIFYKSWLILLMNLDWIFALQREESVIIYSFHHSNNHFIYIG